LNAYAERRAERRSHRGTETPRLWTKPLRPLTPETTHGFAVIEFALVVLGVKLFPWQKWLLVHALELNEDGTYRFRKIFVLVGRQNGKTTLLTVLALWWLFVDSDAFPEHVAAHEFLVLGIAQNLDIAETVWDDAIAYCDPEPDDEDLAGRAIPWLQAETRKPVKTNGKKALRLKSGARYEARADGRGKRAARVAMDEMREQQTWDQWGAVSKTKNAIYNSQLWGFSSAGDKRSVVLAALRDAALKVVSDWDAYVETGVQTLEEFANDHDMLTGIFEWSAVEGLPIDNLDGILQANPSIGYKPGFLETILSDMASDPETMTRTEVLCQWVTARVDTYLDGPGWEALSDPDSAPAADSRIVLGIDVSADRKMTYLSIAAHRADGLIHGELILRKPGMLWVQKTCEKLREKHGITEVAMQTRGAPAADFAEPLREAGFTVVEIAGTALGSSAGQMQDHIRDRRIRHLAQPPLNLAVAGGVTRKLNEVRVWDRSASVVDIAPLVALCNAAYGLENHTPPEPFVSAYEDDDLLVV